MFAHKGLYMFAYIRGLFTNYWDSIN